MTEWLVRSKVFLTELGLYATLERVVVEWGPRLLKLVAVLLVGWVLTRLARRVVRWACARAGVDAKLERLQLAQPLKSVGIASMAALLERLTSLAGLFITLYLAAEIATITSLSRLLAVMLAFLPTLLMAALVGLAGLAAASFARAMLTRMLEGRAGPELARLVPVVVYFALLGFTGVMVAGQLGIDVTLVQSVALLTIAAAMIGLAGAIALGAVPILSQLTARFHAIRHFELGDVLEVDGQRGTLVRFGPTIALLESQGARVVVPYARLMQAPLLRERAAAPTSAQDPQE